MLLLYVNAVCCMMYAASYMLYATDVCCMKYTACVCLSVSVRVYAVCDMLHVHAEYDMLYVLCRMMYAICCVWYIVCYCCKLYAV